MFLVKHSYDERFVTLMGNLHKKYGEAMFELSGIGEKDLDINLYSKSFFKNSSPTLGVEVVSGPKGSSLKRSVILNLLIVDCYKLA